jgi:outer membrane protein assembly factor BamA
MNPAPTVPVYRGQSPEAPKLFNAEAKIAQIIIEGNRTIPASAILPYIHCRAEQSVQNSENQVRQDISKLYETGWFFAVEARFRKTDEGTILVFVVEERPILQSVKYEGNRWIRDRTLSNLTGLVPGHAFSVGVNKEAVRRIREYYREKGYRFAEVTLTKGGEPNDREVIFQITEGPKVRVQSVTFDGNTILSDGVLALKITSKKAILRWFGGQYDPSKVSDDVVALKQFYHSLGFFDVSIKEDVQLSEGKDAVRLHFIVDEGVRYSINNIDIRGNEIFKTDYLTQDMMVKAGVEYNQLQINKDVTKVTEKYGKTGRLFSKVDAIPIFSGTPGKVDLVYNIKEDKVRYIGRIDVNIRSDRAYTKETLVLNQLLFAPGELADPEMIRRSQRRLERAPAWQTAGPGTAPNINIKPTEAVLYARSIADPAMLRGQSPVLDQFTDNLMEATGKRFVNEVPVIYEEEVKKEPVEKPETIFPVSYHVEDDDGEYIGGADDESESEQPEIPTTRIRAIPGVQVAQAGWNLPGMNQPAMSPPVMTQPIIYQTTKVEPANYETSSLHSLQDFDPAQFESGTGSHASGPHNVQSGGMPELLSVSHKESKANSFDSGTFIAPELSPDGIFLDAKEMFESEQFSFINANIDEVEAAQQPSVFGMESAVASNVHDDKTGMIIRGQSYDATGTPPNPVFNQSPNGDIFGQQLRNPEPPGFVDVDVDVTEAQTGRFMFSVGVNSDSGVIGSIVLEEQNFDITRVPRSWDELKNGGFRGNGEQFRIEAVPGSQTSRYMVSWTNPYFMGTNYSLGLSAFYYTRIFESYKETRTGGRIQVGRLLTRYLSANAAVRLENVNVSDPQTTTVQDLNDVLGDNLLATVRPSMSWDTRDSAYMPTEGTYLEGGVEQAFSDFSYTKVELTAKKYFTVHQRIDGQGRHVVSLSGTAGWTSDSTPLFERFYAGGVQTFRGFRFRGVSPRVGSTPIGGMFELLGSTEYVLPITANENFRFIAFTDYGTVDDKASLDAFRVSVGGGLRITIPAMGPVPIALDWAVPLMKEDRDQTRLFQFYMGFTR